MDTTVLKCPGCGSSLPYNAEKGLWVCETCGAEFSEEEILKMTQAGDMHTITDARWIS